jgi:hypothetical protein
VQDYFIDGYNSVLIKDWHFRSIAEAIVPLLVNPALRAALGDNARNFTLRHFSCHVLGQSAAALIRCALQCRLHALRDSALQRCA